MKVLALVVVAACGSKDKPAPRETPPERPRDAAIVDPVVHLASGDGGVCATRASGRGYCWGPVGPRGSVKPVHQVAADATAIYPRYERPCIEHGGNASCASANVLGGCSIAGQRVSCSGRRKGSADPIKGVDRAVDLHLRALYPGGCARDVDGTVTCWGELDGSSRKVFVPIRTQGFGAIAKLAPWGLHSLCALRTSGEVACWTEQGLVDVLEGKPATPTVIAATPGDAWVSVVENCALRASGRVFCWGENSTGEVTGVGDVRERAAKLVDPARVRLLASFSEDPWCAVVPDGSVVCWPTPSQRPALRLPVPASPDDEVKQIVQAGHGACALLARGTVTCFGHEDSARASPAPHPLPGLTDAIAISASFGRICAVRRAGSVACGFVSADPKPLAAVRGIDDAEAVAVSSTFSCALRRGGAVRCWTADRTIDPVGLPPVSQIDVARDAAQPFVCGVGNDHAAWCWGGPDCTTRACRVPNVDDIVELAAAATASGTPAFHARTRDGHVLTWGEYVEHTVKRRDDVTNAKALRAGRYAACIVDASDSVSCWGMVGEHLNDGHRSFVKEPVEIVFPP